MKHAEESSPRELLPAGTETFLLFGNLNIDFKLHFKAFSILETLISNLLQLVTPESFSSTMTTFLTQQVGFKPQTLAVYSSSYMCMKGFINLIQKVIIQPAASCLPACVSSFMNLFYQSFSDVSQSSRRASEIQLNAETVSTEQNRRKIV